MENIHLLWENKNTRNKILEFTELKQIKIASLDMSVRSYNALRRGGIEYLHEAMRYYPDSFDEFRNIGSKSIDEICKTIENFISDNYNQIALFITTGIVETENADPFTLTLKELIGHPCFKEKAKVFLKVHNLPVEEMGLSNRSVGALTANGLNTFADVLKIYPNNISSLRNIGAKSIADIKTKTECYIDKIQDSLRSYCSGNENALYSDEFVFERIMSNFENIGFSGISYNEIRTAFPEDFDESRIKDSIGKLIFDKKLEYVDFRLYKVYPSVFKMIYESDMESNDKIILVKKFNGATLEEIGKELNVTRERIRQKYKKIFERLRKFTLERYGSKLFDEDFYAYLYSNYETDKQLYFEYLGISQKEYGYLANSLTKGKKKIEKALEDESVNLILKFKIQDYLNRNKVLINGILIEKNIANIEDYALLVLCQDEMTYDEFAEKYNQLLEYNNIKYDTSIYYDESIKKTRKNRLSQSMYCLWKQGEKIRYYDINSQDYDELLQTLKLNKYKNIEISTLKFFEDYPDVMDKYGIRDEYELHNLLKKIINVNDFDNLIFSRNPILRFGTFDRNQAVYDILEAVYPVTAEELAEYVHMEYGYAQQTIMAGLFKELNQYLYMGVYSIEFKKIPEERTETLQNNLQEDFYYISEIKKIYKNLFNNADPEEINARSLKAIGIQTFSTYAVKGFSSSDEYFTHILTQSDVYDISAINEKFAGLTTYYSTVMKLRQNYDIFLFDKNSAVTINRLNKIGITKADIKEFCDSAYAIVSKETYFNIYSLRKSGFNTTLDELGFDDYFYNEILAVDPRFLSQRVYGNIILALSSEKLKNISKKTFILYALSQYESIELEIFLQDCSDKYGISISDKYEITSAISNTDFYYDSIMDKIYKNKNYYYAEFDEW